MSELPERPESRRRGRWSAGPSEVFELVESSAALQLMEKYSDSQGIDPFDSEGLHPRCAKPAWRSLHDGERRGPLHSIVQTFWAIKNVICLKLDLE